MTTEQNERAARRANRVAAHRAETMSLFKHLAKHGWHVRSIDDGGDERLYPETLEQAVEDANAVDDCKVYLRHQGQPDWRLSLYLVYGNGPGELINDWGSNLTGIDDEALCDLIYEWGEEYAAQASQS